MAVELASEVQRLVAAGADRVPAAGQHLRQVVVDAGLAAHLLLEDVGELADGHEVGAGQGLARRVGLVEGTPPPHVGDRHANAIRPGIR